MADQTLSAIYTSAKKVNVQARKSVLSSVCKPPPFSAAEDYVHVCIEYKLIVVTHPKMVHARTGQNSTVKWKFSGRCGVLLSLSVGENPEEAFKSYSTLLTE